MPQKQGLLAHATRPIHLPLRTLLDFAAAAGSFVHNTPSMMRHV